jgi:peptide/nickel transport system substrate-binding protein
MRVIRAGAAVAATLTVAVVAAACSSSTSSSGGSGTHAAGAPKHGGTVTVQWVAGGPNFIFPLWPATNTDGYNENLQEPMWPPLVVEGYGSQPIANPQESLYSSLAYSNGDKTITMVLKPWQWSDGTPITSRDFTFMYNLVKAMGQDWEDYLPGLFPQDVSSVQAPDAHTVVINLTQAYNPAFYTDNVLTELQLLPQHAWDKESATGPVGNYDQTTAGAKAVVNFLQKQGSDIGTFATNPLWKVVDGPWTLSEFSSSGAYAFVPNKNYSGPDKPYLSEVIDGQYTTDDAAFDALRAGGTPIAGGIPPGDVKQIPELKSSGYSISNAAIPGVAGIWPNMTAPDGVGDVLQQLYVRQAMEDLINRPELVQQVYAGYADPGNGPVPVTAFPNLVASNEKGQGMYPYSPSTAIGLLKAHGWNVVPNGVTTCQSAGSGPSDCGAGISAGQKLAFTLIYSSGEAMTDEQEAAIVSWEAQAGIKITLKSEPFNTIEGTVGDCNAQSHPASTCSWQLVDFGYNDYGGLQPVGIGLFNTDGVDNQGGYSSKEMDSLINATEYSGSPSAMLQYENYATEQLPMLYLPLPSVLNAYPSDLGGYKPNDAYNDGLNPEVWYFTK